MVLGALLGGAARLAARFIPRAARFVGRRAAPAARAVGRRAQPFITRGRAAISRGISRFRGRGAKRVAKAPPRSLIARVARRGAGIALSAGAFIGAESLIRRGIRSRAPTGAAAPRGALDRDVSRVGRGVGTGAAAAAGAAGGRVGLLKKLGAAALIGGGLFGAEQIAEKLGVRGGAGFIGRRPTTAAAAAAQGLPFRRPRRSRLLITKPEQKAMRSLRSKIKRINKVIGMLGFTVVRKGTSRAISRSPEVITKSEASKALRR